MAAFGMKVFVGSSSINVYVFIYLLFTLIVNFMTLKLIQFFSFNFRPFFTYWVTFVQVVVFIVAIAVYGIAPIGSSETEYTEAVCIYSEGKKLSN